MAALEPSSKPGLYLLKVGGALYAVCAALFAGLTYGLNYRLQEPLELLILPPMLFLFGTIMITGWFQLGYVMGAPAISLIYPLRSVTRNWRGVLGVLLMIGAGMSVFVAACLTVSKF
jgi:hypothetical protein